MADRNLLPGVPWIESPFFEQHLASKAMRAGEIEKARAYRENGFLKLDVEMPDFAAIAARIKTDLADDYKGERRIQDAWKTNNDVRQIACNPAILDMLRFLYGREPIPFQTLNFRVGTEQALHCDAAHFNSMPERFMCGVWVALEDVDEDNGPLEYLAGSHKLPCYASSELGLVSQGDKSNQEYGEYNALWQQLGPALGLERQIFKPSQGEALIWAANLLHGGHRQNDRKRSRHSQVTHYYFADCAYYTPLLSDPFMGRIQFREITDIRTGKIVPNRYAGRDIAPHVMQSLHPNHGINPRDGDRVEAGLPQAAAGHSAASLIAMARHHRFENVQPNAAAIEEHRVFLHPNPTDQPPARLVLENVQIPAGAQVTAAVRVAHAEAASVRFRALFGLVGDKIDDFEPCGECVCAAGQQVPWTFDIPADAGDISLVIETEMAEPGSFNQYAWAYVDNLRLR